MVSANREAFWALTIERLGIRFQQSFRRVLDLSGGVENPRWLVDARSTLSKAALPRPPILRRSSIKPKAVKLKS